MNPLVESLSGPLWREILLTLAHSLWQGAVIALLLAMILSRVAGNRPQARYLASLVSLAALVISCLVTWSILDLPTSQPALDAVTSVAPAVNVVATPMPVNSTMRPLSVVQPPVQASWQTVEAVCNAAWLVGMTVMLVRMAWLLTGVRRLTRRPSITDPRVLEPLERLCRRLGIVRRILVVEATDFGPAVLGVMRPVLLLPVAIISEMSPECLEAILAHELAHIRRHDYLVNLVQMLTEAALFFNPAVWWISRQIRREREACCDALAVGVSGQPLTYAHALTGWLERMHNSRLAPVTAGWLGPKGSALDRVRRLLVADYRPELRGSWPALAAGLTVSALVLIALWSGTRAGVALAAEILSPIERIEQLVEERNELRPVAQPGAKATFAGTIRTVDGGALPNKLLASYLVYTEGASSCGGTRIAAPTFEEQLPWGKTWLTVVAPGYAPAVLGPLYTKPGERLDGQDIVFQSGFNTRLQIVDDHGAPVAGAEVAAIPGGGDCGFPIHWKADDAGQITAEHVGDLDYKLTITAPKSQTFRSGILRFKPDETTKLTLLAAAPTNGMVVSETGDPLPGATIRRVAWDDGKILDLARTFGPILTTTDAHGHFSLDNLDDGTRYSLVVETPTAGRRVFPDVRAGKPGLRWVIGPPWTITGRIIVGPTQSADDLKKISYSQSVTLRKNASSVYEFNVAEGNGPVEHKDDTFQFRIDNVVQVPEVTDGDLFRLGVQVAKQNFQFVLERSTTELTVDLASRATTARHVVLRFVGADAGLSPSGTVFVSGDVRGADQFGALVVPITDGTAQFDVNVPGHVYLSVKNIVGYWFKDGAIEVPTGTDALDHDVPVIPAGAVRGRVFNVDGTPATDVANTNYLLLAGSLPRSELAMMSGSVQTGSAPEFFVSPLPLGGTYVLSASRGFENTYSKPIQLNAATPNPTVDLQFSPVRDVSGQVLGPDGKALAEVAIALELRSPQQETRFNPPHLTGPDGRFEFRGLSTGIGPYWARVRSRRDFQPVDVELPEDGKPLNVQLKAGYVIAGRLINAGTGKALEGVEVFAMPSKRLPTSPVRYEPEQPTTGADGNFRFSTLPEGDYIIRVQGLPSSSNTDAYQTFHTSNGFSEPIELRVLRPPQD